MLQKPIPSHHVPLSVSTDTSQPELREPISLEKIGQAVRIGRKSRRMSQPQLANATRTNKVSIHKIEHGDAKLLSVVVLDQIARFFGVTLSEFIKSVEDNTYMFKREDR